ncbi:MAG: hypothetical protein J5679_03200 [Alphaproteobacteria bacterium]|nr:hypothetical protein [Alphaproteobacteria bacterium]
MIRKNLIMHYSLFAGMVAILAAGDANSAVRIGNTSRNQYVASQMAERQNASVASVNDISAMSGNDVAGGDNSGEDSQLEACEQIYPNGSFEMARPTAGTSVGGARTCTAVVELRGYQMGNGGADAVLARANVAAGSTLNCNISAFPEASYTLDAQRVIFPADAEPTVDDVKQVMNQEQKQNAGMKIAAAALVGAIGGNISGRNEAGKDGLFGTNKEKMTNTLIGAAGGAAIGAGGALAGYEGGNMIMSAGINAVAGAAAGNIIGAGDSVLRIEPCGTTKCVLGYIVPSKPLYPSVDGRLCTDKNGNSCARYYVDLDNKSTVMKCDAAGENCDSVANIGSVSIDARSDWNNKKLLLDLSASELREAMLYGDVFYVDSSDKTKKMTTQSSSSDDHHYALVVSAKLEDGQRRPAAVKLDDKFKEKTFGNSREDFNEWKKPHLHDDVFAYKTEGVSEEKIGEVADFVPFDDRANDGGVIDLDNKARLKSTLVGAGAGGALGAFTAYQGAQSDIDERWVSAVREYKDSLQKFYCVTGDRFLSYYNDVVIIPSVKD